MFKSTKFQSSIAASIALGMTALTATPLMASIPKETTSSPLIIAQQYSQQDRVAIPAGLLIPVSYDEAEKILLAPDETMELTLKVKRNVVSRRGRVLIPGGSEIHGQLEPTLNGTQFVSKEIVVPSGRRLSIDASSRVISETEQVRRGVNGDSVLKGAAIGAGAAAIISGVTGDRAIATEEVLGGAGLGALAGALLGRNKADLIAINTNTDLDLILNSDIVLNRRRRTGTRTNTPTNTPTNTNRNSQPYQL